MWQVIPSHPGHLSFGSAGSRGQARDDEVYLQVANATWCDLSLVNQPGGGLDQEDYTGPVEVEPLLTELKIAGNANASPWVNWLVYIRLQAPGCYAMQVDGLSFRYVIVFQAA